MSDTPKYTDIWNGETFSEMHSDQFRYLTDRETWLTWDGKRWRDADAGDLIRAAEETAKMIFSLALAEEQGAKKDALAWAKHSAGRNGISSMIHFAAAALKLCATVKQFDQHPHLLNVANGTLDLRTGELRDHAREDYLTTLTPIEYKADAKCPRWDQFVREIFVRKLDPIAAQKIGALCVPDEDLVAFVHRAVGYSLTGFTREHACFFLYGVGRNGKGRFVRAVDKLLGNAARTTDFKTFTTLGSTSINSPAVASLSGARLVTAGEPDEGVDLSESLIKSLTGEDEIEAMAKYEAPFRYTPKFKIWLHCNHKPTIRGTDEGIWSRPRMIPFHVRFDNIDGKGTDARDLKLDETLDSEIEGILAWAVRGAALWFVQGLGTAAAVKEATDDYRSEQDTIGAFVDEALVLDARGQITASAMHRAYERWCMSTGIKYPLGPDTLKARLDGRDGIRYKRTSAARLYHGVRERENLGVRGQNGAGGNDQALAAFLAGRKSDEYTVLNEYIAHLVAIARIDTNDYDA